MAHQINQLFQYQEEKLQRSDSWEAPNEDVSGPHGQFPSKKKPLLSTPGSPRGRARDPMDDAELTYYEHKSKLRRTRVNRRPPGGDDWDGDMGSEDGDFEGPMLEGGPGTLARKYSRSPPIRPGRFRPGSGPLRSVQIGCCARFRLGVALGSDWVLPSVQIVCRSVQTVLYPEGRAGRLFEF